MAERGTAGSLAPVRKRLVVPASPDVAFGRFTAELGTWWPMAPYSVFGAGATVSFGEGAGEPIVERSADGEEAVWGTVTAWDPPRRVAFTWHPGRDADAAQDVEVTFLSTGEGTEVTLVHGGWASLGDAAEETRGSYDSGWDVVLGAFRDAV